MAKFGDWQKHLDFCLESLLSDSKQFELFKKCKTDEKRIYFVRKSGVLKCVDIECPKLFNRVAN